MVIVGAGFAGLECAKGLKGVDVDVTVVDRRNHHLFQPLLYQVATASLSPADIAWPIRHVLARQANARVVLGEVVRVDAGRRVVVMGDGGEVGYDVVCLCCGVSHSYFGHGEWEASAPGLKTVEDALEIRRRFLVAFERAERETDAGRRRALLTFVVVGGGPTGVELAGAMAEIARKSLVKDFRSIDPTTARIVLVEGGDRLLGAMPRELSERAKKDLERLGVEVVLGRTVTGVDGRGVVVGDPAGTRTSSPPSPPSVLASLEHLPRRGGRGGERIDAGCVLWAAGVEAERGIAGSMGVEVDRAGRVRVEKNLTVAGRPEVFVLGDLAVVEMASKKGHHAERGGTRKEVPGIAPAAMQMGRYAARVIRGRVERGWSAETAAERRGARERSAAERRTTPEEPATPEEPFVYVDKGLLATIGRARAVAAIGGWKFGGIVAWLLWAGVHVFYLIGARSRVLVMVQWAWEWAVFARGARLITGEGRGDGEGERRRGEAENR